MAPNLGPLPLQEYHLAEMATILAAAWLTVTPQDQFNDRGEMANLYALKQAKHLMTLIQKEQDSLENSLKDVLQETEFTKNKRAAYLKIIDELLIAKAQASNLRVGDLYTLGVAYMDAMNCLHDAYNKGEIHVITKSLADHFTALNIRNQGAEYKHL